MLVVNRLRWLVRRMVNVRWRSGANSGKTHTDKLGWFRTPIQAAMSFLWQDLISILGSVFNF